MAKKKKDNIERLQMDRKSFMRLSGLAIQKPKPIRIISTEEIREAIEKSAEADNCLGIVKLEGKEVESIVDVFNTLQDMFKWRTKDD